MKTEEEMEVLEKYRKELICPICQSELVNKDYKINKRTFYQFLIIMILSFIAGVLA